jgi:hypothetical protein
MSASKETDHPRIFPRSCPWVYGHTPRTRADWLAGPMTRQVFGALRRRDPELFMISVTLGSDNGRLAGDRLTGLGSRTVPVFVT